MRYRLGIAAAVCQQADGRDKDRELCEHPDALNTTDDPQWCVSFRTLSSRNAALRPASRTTVPFARLRDVVQFYATRATKPRALVRARRALRANPGASTTRRSRRSRPFWARSRIVACELTARTFFSAR
jgi:cytochrome c peroxidase